MTDRKKIIDSHQHFLKISRGDYTWLTPEYAALNKDFLPGNLKPTLDKLHIDGTILVHAAATPEETHFLLNIANDIEFVLGVVGWVDIEARYSPDKIEALSRDPYFLGIRALMQYMPDVDWMLQSELTAPLNTLAELNLTLDALVTPNHLKNLMRLIERHPDLRIIIDHAGKPSIKDGKFEPWADDLEIIARNSEAYCKLSGLIEEAGNDWTIDALAPYLDHILESFGPERVLWGSNWPVITMASDYEQWFELSHDYLTRHFPHAVDEVFGGVAGKVYGVS